MIDLTPGRHYGFYGLMFLVLPLTLIRLLEAVIDQLVAVLRYVSVDLESEQYNKRNEWLLDRSTSTGGRPACCITKEQVEQLRETGTNWCKKVMGLRDFAHNLNIFIFCSSLFSCLF